MKTTTVSFTEAKSRLSEFARRAESGGTTLVLKHRRPAFMIVPLPPSGEKRRKKPGLALGQIWMAPDFAATPEDILSAFEGQV